MLTSSTSRKGLLADETPRHTSNKPFLYRSTRQFLFCANIIFRAFCDNQTGIRPTSCKQGNQDGIRKTKIQIIPNSVC